MSWQDFSRQRVAVDGMEEGEDKTAVAPGCGLFQQCISVENIVINKKILKKCYYNLKA